MININTSFTCEFEALICNMLNKEKSIEEETTFIGVQTQIHV